MIDLILVGGGGHCNSVIDSIRALCQYNIVGIIDFESTSEVNGVKIIGNDDQLKKIFDSGVNHAFITVGSIGNTSIRQRLGRELKAIGYILPVIIDPTAIVSKTSVIGEGTFIGKGTIVNAGSNISRNCIINTGSIIEHDCLIGDYVHIASGTVLSGSVTIGNDTHVGTNSTVIQNVNICNDVIIGAGSVVVKDILKPVVAYGNPCKEKQN